MKKHLVIFQPLGKRGHVADGTVLTEAARQLGADLESICGRKATCGKCSVLVEEGAFSKYGIEFRRANLSPMTESEQKVLTRRGLGEGYRLACVTEVHGDVVVFVPEESRVGKQIVHKAISARTIELKPAMRNYYVELSPPSLEDSVGDWERLTAELAARFGLENLTIDYPALRGLQRALREGDWRATATVWLGREVIRVQPGLVEKSYGLAVDIGSTTVAGYLCDLEDGRVLATASLMNPQLAYGEDVMSRITFADTNPDGLARLHQAIIEALNSLARDVAGRAGLATEEVVEMVLVGNTAMHHLALNIDPSYLGRAPFPPAGHRSLDVKARELGIAINPGANVHILPIEAGFVGADNVGVLLAVEPHKQEKVWLIIDIGTNGELVVGHRRKLLCASCATGPALEGGHLRFGMRAAPGAIERVRIDPQSWEVSFRVIGQSLWSKELPDEKVQAKGICGTGVIEAVAEMVSAGIVERRGRLNSKASHPRLRLGEEGPEFVLAWAAQTSLGKDITISQRDVQAVGLAKAAMYSASKLLLGKLGLQRPDKVILAGAFGSLVDPERAMALGMFPDMDLSDVYAVGNAAGEGARIALLNVDKRAEANEIVRRVEHVELTLEKNFQDEFMYALFFPHMRDSFPHLELRPMASTAGPTPA